MIFLQCLRTHMSVTDLLVKMTASRLHACLRGLITVLSARIPSCNVHGTAEQGLRPWSEYGTRRKANWRTPQHIYCTTILHMHT
jgi:hypothetical protein